MNFDRFLYWVSKKILGSLDKFISKKYFQRFWAFSKIELNKFLYLFSKKTLGSLDRFLEKKYFQKFLSFSKVELNKFLYWFSKKILGSLDRFIEKRYFSRFLFFLKKNWKEFIIPVSKILWKEFKIISVQKYKEFKFWFRVYRKRFYKYLRSLIFFLFVFLITNGKEILILNSFLFLKLWRERKYTLLLLNFLKYLLWKISPYHAYKEYLVRELKKRKSLDFYSEDLYLEKISEEKNLNLSKFLRESLINFFRQEFSWKKEFPLKKEFSWFSSFFRKKEGSVLEDSFFSLDELISNSPWAIKKGVLSLIKRSIKRNRKVLSRWFSEKVQKISDTVEFESSEFIFLNQKLIEKLLNKKSPKTLIRKEDSTKDAWNIQRYSYDNSHFLSKIKLDQTDYHINQEFNEGCGFNDEFKNNIFYSLRYEFSEIKKLLDNLPFPILPLPSSIPLFLMKASLDSINSMLDQYKIKDFSNSELKKDILPRPYKKVHFSHGEAWDTSPLLKKMAKDRTYLHKYLHYSGKRNTFFPNQPFNNFYLRKYWTISLLEYFWVKFQCYIGTLYNLEAFERGGESLRFEESILSNPETCLSYFNKISKTVGKEYEEKLQEYFSSEAGLYPRLPFDLNFSNLECHSNLLHDSKKKEKESEKKEERNEREKNTEEDSEKKEDKLKVLIPEEENQESSANP